MKNFLKNCPLLAGILLGTALLTIVALCGFHNIYATQEYDPLKQPLLAVVFTGINDEIYPWDFFDEAKPLFLIIFFNTTLPEYDTRIYIGIMM